MLDRRYVRRLGSLIGHVEPVDRVLVVLDRLHLRQASEERRGVPGPTPSVNYV